MDNNEIIAKDIFVYAYKLLAHRPYATAEFQKKLNRKFPRQPKEIEEALERLKENHYLDDKEYAQLFIESRLRKKPQSIKLMKWDLRKKGLASDTIEQSLEKEAIDEVEMARLAAQKKLKGLMRFPALKQKEKLYRFLLGRGFSSSIIFQILNECISQKSGEPPLL